MKLNPWTVVKIYGYGKRTWPLPQEPIQIHPNDKNIKFDLAVYESTIAKENS